jgi:hypothetical protein
MGMRSNMVWRWMGCLLMTAAVSAAAGMELRRTTDGIPMASSPSPAGASRCMAAVTDGVFHRGPRLNTR